MAPSLAESVVSRELGSHPTKLFLDWNPTPVAAAADTARSMTAWQVSRVRPCAAWTTASHPSRSMET